MTFEETYVLKKLVEERITEREKHGHNTLQNSDITDILEQCKLLGIKVSVDDLKRI